MRHVITYRNRTTKDQISEILELYSKGNSVVSITKLTGVSNGSVFRVLKSYKVTRTLSQAQTIVNRDCLFTDVNKEKVQYWLGFLCADGYLDTSSNVVLNLSIKDKEHILKYKEFVSGNYIEISKTNSCRVYFGNKVVHSRLVSYGITTKKTQTIEFKLPLTVPFVRGVFDGDGCITISKTTPKFEIVSASYLFIMQLHKFFKDNSISLNLKVYNNLWRITTSKKETITNIYKLLYEGSTIELERKYNRFGSVIEKSMTKQSAKSGKSEPSIPSQQ